MRNSKVQKLAMAAMVAAIYFVLCYFGNIFQLTFGPVQVRLGEALTVLPFLFPAAAPGLALGCLLPFESVAFEAGVSLESAIAPGVSVLGDEGQLRRLVMILLDNAVKYAGSGGRAALTLVRQQDKVRLTVHNTGAPIPAEHLPHLFERFYRVDAARDRAQGGYGLGLPIAQAVVQAHRGTIAVRSDAAHGTVFSVTLPLSHVL